VSPREKKRWINPNFKMGPKRRPQKKKKKKTTKTKKKKKKKQRKKNKKNQTKPKQNIPLKTAHSEHPR